MASLAEDMGIVPFQAVPFARAAVRGGATGMRAMAALGAAQHMA